MYAIVVQVSCHCGPSTTFEYYSKNEWNIEILLLLT